MEEVEQRETDRVRTEGFSHSAVPQEEKYLHENSPQSDDELQKDATNNIILETTLLEQKAELEQTTKEIAEWIDNIKHTPINKFNTKELIVQHNIEDEYKLTNQLWTNRFIFLVRTGDYEFVTGRIAGEESTLISLNDVINKRKITHVSISEVINNKYTIFVYVLDDNTIGSALIQYDKEPEIKVSFKNLSLQ